MARKKAKVIRRKIVMPKKKKQAPKPGEMDYQATRGAVERGKKMKKMLDQL